MFRYFFGGNS
jgi:hypothetical protein